jgi:anti-sigma-K factor RskA
MSTQEPRDADERYLTDLIGSLDDEDFHLDDPPADLWDRIESETARADGWERLQATTGPADWPEPVAPVRPISRLERWSRPLAVAALVVCVLCVAGFVAVRRTEPTGEIAASARLTSEGLPNQNDLVGKAALVDVGGRQEIDLDVPDLPPTTDTFYEVWLIAPDGKRLQSLGTTDGRGRYEVPTGIDPRRYPIVDVSREPPDGNPAHSGDSLVRGTLDL